MEQTLDCIILVGGLGTRLQSVVKDVPKPLAQINETPFLDYLLQKISKISLIKNIVLACSYKAEKIKEYIECKNYPFSIHYSIEEQPLGTGGALKQALNHAHTSTVLALNGDSFIDFNLEDFLNFHQHSGAHFSLYATEVLNSSRYGTISVEKNGLVTEFKEKTNLNIPGIINAGVYLCKQNVFSNFNSPPTFSLEQTFFPYLVAQQKIAAYIDKHHSFIDIGTPESYTFAQTFFKELSLRDV